MTDITESVVIYESAIAGFRSRGVIVSYLTLKDGKYNLTIKAVEKETNNLIEERSWESDSVIPLTKIFRDMIEKYTKTAEEIFLSSIKPTAAVN